METTAIDQRQDVRADLNWPVSVWLPQANRFYNAESVNVSKGGACISVPMTAPLKAGSYVEINFPRTARLAKQKGSFARIKTGKVVRVERQGVLEDASIRFAVQFV